MVRWLIEFRGLSSAGRAVALQASGRRFDPDRLHQSRSSGAKASVVGRLALKEREQVSEIMSPIAEATLPNVKHREKGICLGPREREPIGH